MCIVLCVIFSIISTIRKPRFRSACSNPCNACRAKCDNFLHACLGNDCGQEAVGKYGSNPTPYYKRKVGRTQRRKETYPGGTRRCKPASRRTPYPPTCTTSFASPSADLDLSTRGRPGVKRSCKHRSRARSAPTRAVAQWLNWNTRTPQGHILSVSSTIILQAV